MALNAIALARDGTPFVVTVGAAGVRGSGRPATTGSRSAALGDVSSFHPAMTFDRQNRLHVAWLEGDVEIRYVMRDAAGGWSRPEVAIVGNPAVLSNGGGDQSPSITVDAADQPMVLLHVGSRG